MIIYLLLGIIIVIILYLLAIMPKIFSKPSIAPFLGRYYAHRGLHTNNNIVPENSLTAFKLAVDNQYGIELDVQLSSDGVPIVFHDFSLKRVCGVDKNVSDLTFNELRELRLYDSDEVIPRFNEVLDLVNGQIPLIVEIKMETNNTKVCNVIEPLLENYNGPYCIESFHPFVLIWYKKNRPEVIRGQLSSHFNRKKGTSTPKILNFILQNLLLNFLTRPDFIAYNYKYSDTLSLKLCRRLYKSTTIAYTIKSSNALEENLKNFDLFIFENFTP